MDIWVASSSWLLWIVLLQTRVHKYFFFFTTLSTTLYGIAGSYCSSIFLNFLSSCPLFSIAYATFYIPTNSTQGFQFLYILTSICSVLFSFLSPLFPFSLLSSLPSPSSSFLFLVVVILMGMRWYLSHWCWIILLWWLVTLITFPYACWLFVYNL